MENMKKVLIYSPAHDNVWGGGQIYIEQLCSFMNKKGIETYILSSLPQSFNCPTKQMPIAHPKSKRFIHVFGLARQYKKQGFNDVILNDLASLWLAPIFKAFRFRVFSLLLINLQRKIDNPLGHSPVEHFLLRLAARYCDGIFSVDKHNQKVFGEKNVKFVGNFVPDWFFQQEKHCLKKTYDFVMIARFAKQKNIPLFLTLLEQLNGREGNDYTALIVGDGPEKNLIDTTIHQKGLQQNVFLNAWVSREDLASIYDMGKCFVISSLHEGFATTLIEAHARGLPAIVTKSAGFCSEFIEGYGEKTGLVFKKADVYNDNFLSEVEKLLKNFDTYESSCKNKSQVFSEDNVFGPICNAIVEE